MLIMHVMVSQRAFPKLEFSDAPVAPTENDVDGSRITLHLGMIYTPLEKSLVDMASSLIETGIAKPRSEIHTKDPTPACL